MFTNHFMLIIKFNRNRTPNLLSFRYGTLTAEFKLMIKSVLCISYRIALGYQELCAYHSMLLTYKSHRSEFTHSRERCFLYTGFVCVCVQITKRMQWEKKKGEYMTGKLYQEIKKKLNNPLWLASVPERTWKYLQHIYLNFPCYSLKKRIVFSESRGLDWVLSKTKKFHHFHIIRN